MAYEVNNQHEMASMPAYTNGAPSSRSSTSAWYSTHETAATLEEYEEIKALPRYTTEKLQNFDKSQSPENVVEAAKDVLEKRFQAQRAFRESLKEYCFDELQMDWADAIAAMDLRLPQCHRQSSNAKYDQWLDSDSSVRLPMSHTSLERTMYCTGPVGTRVFYDVYELDIDALVQPEIRGALICQDLSLRRIYELASRVPLNVGFFAEHLFYPFTMDADLWSFKGNIWQLDGLEIDDQASGMRGVMMLPLKDPWRKLTVPGCALTRVSYTTLETNRSFFILLRKAANQRISSQEEIGKKSPLGPAQSILPADPSIFSYSLLSFFGVAWNCRRLGRIMECAQHRLSAYRPSFYAWLLAVHCYQDQIKSLEQRVRELDYDLIQPLDQGALNQVRARRAEVSHLRRNLARTREGLTAGRTFVRRLASCSPLHDS